MGDRPTVRRGDETPDSPLIFSVPTSLQEYVSRYVDRPGEQAPPPFPVRHWFDHQNSSGTADTRASASSPPPLPAGATAFEDNATAAAAGAPEPHVTTSTLNGANPATGGMGRPLRSEYLTAWRTMSGPPLLGLVEPAFESEGQQPPSRRRPRTYGVENDREYGGDGSDGGGGGGRGGGVSGARRVQARSASRDGRPQSSTDARRSGGGLGGDDGGGGHPSSGNGVWTAERGGNGVPHLPFPPMGMVRRGNGGRSGEPAGALGPSPADAAHLAMASNSLMGWRRQGTMPPPGNEHEGADERHPRVGEVSSPPRGSGGNLTRARRSLSDFLREIEEMVRAQRESREPNNLPLRPRALWHQQTEGARSHSTPTVATAAAAAAMVAAPLQDYSSGDGGSDGFGEVRGGSNILRGDTRYLPPGQRGWPLTRGHGSRTVPDDDAGAAPPRFHPTHLPATLAAGAGSYGHHLIPRWPGEASAPSSETTGIDPSYYYQAPTTSTGIVDVAGVVAARPAAVASTVAALHGGRPSTAALSTPLHPRMRLSAAATAFSMPPSSGGGSNSTPDQHHRVAPGGSGSGSGSRPMATAAADELIRRRQTWADEWRAVVQEQHALAVERRPLNGAASAVADDGGRQGRTHAESRGLPAATIINPDESWRRTQTEGLAQVGLGFATEGQPQQGPHGRIREVVPRSRMVALPPERGAAASPSTAPSPTAAALATGGNSGGGAEAMIVEDLDQGQSHPAALPAFRHGEAHRARLRIQWHGPNESPEFPAGTDSPASDGTMVVTEYLPSSRGPSPREGGETAFMFGRVGQAGGGGGDGGSEVEGVLFSCLMSLGVRRLLVRRPGGETAARVGNRRSPAWLQEWLDDGARPDRPECSSSGPPGFEGRCPRVGDVWELLELLLGWWAERLCAVAAGFPAWSGSAAAVAAAGTSTGGAGTLGQQQQQGGSRSATTQAVEAVQLHQPDGGEGSGWRRAGDVAVKHAAHLPEIGNQGLRKLGEYLVPLGRVRGFIGIDGGPTPRDAVLLKSLLVVHEGIAWAVDRPAYRHYREEVIPTALALYASLPQDVLEGVDLEVGHTLPESVFVATGTTRPSWPRWGGSPQQQRQRSTVRLTIEGGGVGNSSSGIGAAHHGRGFGGGEGRRFSRWSPTNGGGRNGGGGDDTVGGAGAAWRGAAGGWEADGGRDGGGRRRAAFAPGPWVIFRVARESYLEFYGDQAAALDQAVGGSAAELEHMLM